MSAHTPFNEEVPLLPSIPTVHDKDLHSASETSTSASDSESFTNVRHHKHEYSLFVAICFSLNYSIGSGILGLPFEYVSSGYVLGSLLLTVMAFLTYITYTYVMDGMQRAEALTILSEQFAISRHDLLNKPSHTTQILSRANIDAQTLQSYYGHHRNEYQLSELIGMFAGKWWKLSYDITFICMQSVTLWSYSSLFGVSLARDLGINLISQSCDMTVSSGECRGLYSFYVFIFWLWTVIVTLMDFTQQKCIQIFAAAARILIISLMIVTSIGLIYSSYFYNGQSYVLRTEYTSASVSAWNWTGVASMIGVSSFAYGNQYCVTDIIRPLSPHNRAHNQHKLWSYSVLICAVVYIVCGVTVSLYFGANTESPATLAWEGFMGFAYTDSETQPLWALIVAWLIVLFPAIDIGSAYPLNAVTLANTIEVAIMNNDNGNGNGTANQSYFNVWNWNERYNILIRILLCTLTALLALIEWNFDLILSISGAFGLLAVYGGPCVLEWKSRQMMQAITNNTNVNAHQTQSTKQWTSHKAWVIVISAAAIIAFIAVFVDIIQTYA